ncbi:hypothetical protein SAMN04487928_11917 [Butyrivibrio proteoclasticus]|uniref:Glycosyl transferase GT2 family n=2 Tax=Butyrivibrio proteoclasticus TaxID=43305 RepID=A0A1I5VUM3_9FIRM|nr:hypothetical protein SAMN04487928_11917 [Butyrivibrio proteoclasticus]
MDKLAICVPTYMHKDVVEEVLLYSLSFLKKYGVDIYYYDSSGDNEVKELIGHKNGSGFDNVHFVSVPTSYLYGDKIDLIFSKEGLTKEYNYIWPIKDRSIPNETMLKAVLDRCDDKSDVIISLGLGDIYDGDRFDLRSPENLYKLFSKQITSLETVIYNTRTMLEDYRFGGSNNCSKAQNDFWHYWFLFDKLAQIDNPKIALVSKKGAYNMVSSVQTANNWRKRIFEVWIDEFIEVNYLLPDIYSPYKTQAIKETVSIGELLGEERTFIELYKEGILTKEVYEKYRDFWEFVTCVPSDTIRRIAYGEV